MKFQLAASAGGMEVQEVAVISGDVGVSEGAVVFLRTEVTEAGSAHEAKRAEEGAFN